MSLQARWSTSLALLLATAGCGFPLARYRVEHVAATGWTSAVEPVALLWTYSVHDRFIWTSDTGPIQRRARPTGIALRDAKGTVFEVAAPEVEGESLDVLGAIFLHHEQEFVAIAGRGQPTRCLRIDLQGRASECPLPEPCPVSFILDARGQIHGWWNGRAAAFSTITGQESAADPLLARSEPDAVSGWLLHRTLDRDARQLAAAVWVQEEDPAVWLYREADEPAVLTTIDEETLEGSEPRPGGRPDATRLGFGFAFSSEGRRLYYCGRFAEEGLLLDLDPSPAKVTTAPCLRAAAWSPDDRVLLGVARDGELERWDVPAPRD
jgi:hypothetical protein